MKYLLLVFFFIMLFLSCENKKEEIATPKVTRDSIAFAQKKKYKVINVSLLPKASKAMQKWKEYRELSEFIKQFNTISTAEALSNAEELSTLATYLKDSIRDNKLKVRSVKTRFNIFQNECLRLKDMEQIPAITEHEVNTKVKEVLEAFASINAKLNSVYEVNALENELELDPDFKKILIESGLDTTKIEPKKNPRADKRYDKFKNRKKPKKKIGFINRKHTQEQE